MSEPHSHAAHNGSAGPAPVRSAAPARTLPRRHRSATRGAATEAERRRMLRLAVVPPLLVTVVAVAVVGYLLRDPARPAAGVAGATWGVLVGALLLSCALVAGAAYVAGGEARNRSARLTALRRQNAQGRAELQSLVRRVEHGERVRPPAAPPPASPGEGDGLDLLAQELAAARHAAATAVAEAAAAVRGSGSDEKVEVFASLARRLQSLAHREIEHLDELENEVEDPDLLRGLFHVDHLATRIRRHAENLAVLGGAVSRRQWSRPVGMTEVLRAAVAEVQHYSRVKLVPPVEGSLRGHAVADVIHLLAELVENATVYSAPGTQVLLRAQFVTAGLAVEVEDRGLGMTAAEQNRMNALLSGAEPVDIGALLRDGRIGLFVVASLAHRHNIVVQLQSNIYGGVQAVLVLPRELLGEHAAEPPSGRHAAPAAASAPPQDLSPQDAPEPGAGPSAPAGPAPLRPLVVAPRVEMPAPAAPTGADPAPAGADPAPPGGERPALPRRRRQQHLAPGLREEPPAAPAARDDETGHDPGLMAAFRRGASLAEGPEH